MDRQTGRLGQIGLIRMDMEDGATNRQSDKQTDKTRQKDRQTSRQKDRQTERQIRLIRTGKDRQGQTDWTDAE